MRLPVLLILSLACVWMVGCVSAVRPDPRSHRCVNIPNDLVECEQIVQE